MSETTDVLSGRTAIVTGGARGLGYAIAQALARSGASVVLADLLPTVEDSAATLAGDTGTKTLGVVVDVTDPNSVDHAYGDAEAKLGVATILVNAAGISTDVPLLETTPEQWNRIMNVNVNGTLYSGQAFARRAIAAGAKATIINISSMSGYIVNIPQTQAAYNTSKAAVVMLTKNQALEWHSHGIRVNAIAPGYFASDMTRDFAKSNPEMRDEWVGRVPIGRMGEPHELGDLAVYLASEGSSYMVGQNVIIDGGYTIV
jgi:NAD(P)-dependent dehydrogenase (short-subunit alcohol dehydrogenase family)